jgi:hypothetical protein
MRMPRNMIVVRDGESLTILHAVRLGPEAEKALEALGKIENVVKIGWFHGMDDGYYKERFGATYWATGGRVRSREPRPDRSIEEGGKLPIKHARAFAFKRSRRPEGALLLERDGGILLPCDSIQAWDTFEACTPVMRGTLKVLGYETGRPTVAPLWRLTMGGSELRDDYERMLSLNFTHMLAAHGGVVRGNARMTVRGAIERSFAR